MNKSVRLSDIPARPWLSADAGRWTGEGPSGWTFPLWPVLLLAVGVVVAIMASPDEVCTPQAPCGEEWGDAVGSLLFWPQMWWLFLLPEAAVLCTPLLALFMAEPGNWQGGTALKAADAVVVLGICWGLAASVERLRRRRAQRVRLREAAGGITARVPERVWTGRSKRGVARVVMGLVLGAVAAAVITSIALHDRAADRSARTATVANVPVVSFSSGDYVLTVRLPDGSRHHFDTIGDYTGSDTVRVLMHGDDHVRLAAEPYGDNSGRQLLALSLGGLGLVAVSSGLVAAARAARLRRVAVPVLRVRARVRGGTAEVFAYDDPEGLRPVLHYVPDEDTRTPMRQALLFGEIAEGGELLLASRTERGRWRLDPPASAVRMGGDGDADDDDDDDAAASAAADTVGSRGRQGDGDRRADAPPDPLTLKERWAAEARIQQALAEMRAARVRPTRWHADTASRLGAVALSALTLLIAASVATDFSVWRVAWLVLVVPPWLGRPLAVLAWRISADSQGLRIRRHLRTRRVPWAQVAGASCTGGYFTIDLRSDPPPADASPGTASPADVPGGPGTRTDAPADDMEPASEIEIDSVGYAWLARRLGREPAGPRVAAEITAMAREAELRPQPAAGAGSFPDPA